jgi:hypothetical protein
MSLHPTPRGEVPASTAAVARAAFLHGNADLRLCDQLGTIFADAQFALCSPGAGSRPPAVALGADHSTVRAAMNVAMGVSRSSAMRDPWLESGLRRRGRVCSNARNRLPG